MTTTTDQIRVRKMSEAQRTMLALLSMEERTEALMRAAQEKQRRLVAELSRESSDTTETANDERR